MFVFVCVSTSDFISTHTHTNMRAHFLTKVLINGCLALTCTIKKEQSMFKAKMTYSKVGRKINPYTEFTGEADHCSYLLLLMLP